LGWKKKIGSSKIKNGRSIQDARPKMRNLNNF
jgi:hypothetical protein